MRRHQVKTVRRLPVGRRGRAYRRCMITTHHFSEVFGDDRGALASQTDRYGSNHRDIEHLLAHIAAASSRELRRITRPAARPLGRHALVLGFAAGTTAQSCPAEHDAVIKDLREHLRARPDHSQLAGETERVMQEIALCMLIKQDLSETAVRLIRELLALADPKVDEALGQPPLTAW